METTMVWHDVFLQVCPQDAINIFVNILVFDQKDR